VERIKTADDSEALVIDGIALARLKADRVKRLPIAPRRAIVKWMESCRTHAGIYLAGMHPSNSCRCAGSVLMRSSP
jgi:hypothetical protein